MNLISVLWKRLTACSHSQVAIDLYPFAWNAKLMHFRRTCSSCGHCLEDRVIDRPSGAFTIGAKGLRESV